MATVFGLELKIGDVAATLRSVFFNTLRKALAKRSRMPGNLGKHKRFEAVLCRRGSDDYTAFDFLYGYGADVGEGATTIDSLPVADAAAEL